MAEAAVADSTTLRPNRRKPTLDPFEVALSYLPQIRDGDGGRDYWHIGEARNVTVHGVTRPEYLGDYALDCCLGEALWRGVEKLLRTFPDQTTHLINDTLKSMVEHGVLSGVEIAFITRLSLSFAPRPSRPTLAVIE